MSEIHNPSLACCLKRNKKVNREHLQVPMEAPYIGVLQADQRTYSQVFVFFGGRGGEYADILAFDMRMPLSALIFFRSATIRPHVPLLLPSSLIQMGICQAYQNYHFRKSSYQMLQPSLTIIKQKLSLDK